MTPNAFRRRAAVLLGALALTAAATPAAHAQPVHQVEAGESLWQIAALNGLSPATLAAANGLSPDAAVQAGQIISIPAGGGAAGTSAATTVVASTAGSSGSTASSSAPTGAGSATGASAGGVVVQPGDTLSAIAARAGVSVTALAAHNGVNASALLPAGRRLSLPAAGSAARPAASSATATGSTATATGTATTAGAASGTTASAGAGTGSSSGSTGTTATASATGTSAPATPSSGTRVSATDVGSAAAANGVPASLARAIAWQESGFNNGAVSSVGARGVMQVMPGTWTWINRNLSSRTLDPSSAADNVQAGTLYLQHLLRETGGDPDQAAAAYYQGLSSVRSRGMYDDTKRYVENVRALRSRFGG